MVSVATSELLDEQLDEIRLVLKNSTVEHYPPTTEVKIEFYADGELEEPYMQLLQMAEARNI